MVLFADEPKRPKEGNGATGRRASVLWKRRSHAPADMTANADAQKAWVAVQRPPSHHSSHASQASQASRPTSKSNQANKLSILDQADAKALTTAHSAVDMSWYPFWLQRQLDNIPVAVKELRVGTGLLAEDMNSALEQVFTAVRAYVKINAGGADVDEILYHLQAEDLIDGEPKLLDAQRLLVFAVLGWLSMLYKPAFNICSLSELAVSIPEPDSGLMFDEWKIPVNFSERPLHVLLKGFGNLLPARSSETSQVSGEAGKLASSWAPIYPEAVNAFKLHNLMKVNIRWVDTVSLHLDYDRSSKTLSLFGCPSFCVAMLQSKCSGAIYSFASNLKDLYEPRATKEDITQYLQEVLLSYRLLFGQSPAARKYFQKTFKPAEELGFRVDSLLPLLCTQQKKVVIGKLMPVDRDIYYAGRDFPVLYDRIEVLTMELKNWKPDSVAGLVKDRRDQYSWWTFWLVAVFGLISILLSVAQVILAVIQVSQGAQ